jgi:hypothetical protein
MSQQAATNLRQSIRTLFQTIWALHQAGGADPLFLQNLEQLHDNIVNIYEDAGDPAGQLDVATIGAHLHDNLRQSAFTDSRGQFNVPVQGAPPNAPLNNPGHPSEPFTVNSGKSAYGVFSLQVPVAGMPSTAIIPLHNAAIVNPGPVALLPNPPITTIGDIRGLQAQVVGFPLWLAQKIRDSIADQAQNFSNNAHDPKIAVRQLSPGEVLVRCCQNGSREPGSWWVLIENMPQSITDVRNGLAVSPNWNQNGNLDFFLVPEGCDLFVLYGIASDQRLPADVVNTTSGPVWAAAGYVINISGNPYSVNDPRSISNPVWDPTFHSNAFQRDGIKRSAKFIRLAPGEVFGQGAATVQALEALVNTNRDVTGQYLVGGHRQIFIVNGGMNFQNYMPCIAVIETGFNVET